MRAPRREVTVCGLRDTVFAPRPALRTVGARAACGGIFPIRRGNWWDDELAAEPSGFRPMWPSGNNRGNPEFLQQNQRYPLKPRWRRADRGRRPCVLGRIVPFVVDSAEASARPFHRHVGECCGERRRQPNGRWGGHYVHTVRSR